MTFLLQRISNEADSMKQVFQKVFSIEVDDALRFDVENITIKNITEFKEYHGLNVSTVAYLDRTRIPISIDIGFGDIVYPEKVKMDFPALLNMDSPILYAYSRESIIAEKYEAIIQLGYGNGRLKDFYDIYLLSKNFDFDGETLKEAVRETLEHRKTIPDDSSLYEDDFINDPLLSSRWDTFKKQKQAFDTLSFKETIIFIRKFMFPIIKSIKDDSSFEQHWNHINLSWE